MRFLNKRVLFFIIAMIAIIIPSLVIVATVIAYFQPDVVTIVHHAAQPAYDSYEHSHDGWIGLGILGILLATGGFLIASILGDDFAQ